MTRRATYHAILDPKWVELRALAEARMELSRTASNTRVMTDDYIFKGLCGEHCYERTTGLPMNMEVQIADGGTDFRGVDVKTARFEDAVLRVRPESLKAPMYVLVAAAMDERVVSTIGWATRRMVKEAPLVDVGFGPAHALAENELMSGDEAAARLLDLYVLTGKLW